MQRRLIALLALTSCAPFTSWAADELKFPTTPPTEPQNAAKTFHVLDGFQMQLIAAEPLVTDPVAITYDEDGRAYVCEMNDYPYTDKEHHKHAQENPTDQSIGKVRLLTDTDGDGVFDKATIFAEGLSWPTGAACWKGGIFVTATPDVWYLKDTNGDGVADLRQKVFTGFKKLNVQAVMNNPIWGLDHRIYIAGGSNGGEIQRAPGSESVMPLPADFKPLSIKRNDFSFDPSTGDVRLESGGARFGNTFDDWGNRFLCNIRNPCQHVVLPYRYLARNPYLVVPSALNDCAEAGDQLPVYRTSPPEPWREFRAKRWVQEGSTLPKSELVGAGVVTSSAGITVYRGDAYPPEYRDFVFVADVAGNLFYRMKLVPDGVTFKAVQVDGTKNFCTSDDLWCRPVNFVNAPDGCLHVCDMYREVIEHPWSIPDDIHSAVDLLRGRDKGRLYRLAPKSFKARPTPKLSTSATPDLVALLDHPNAWHRETAQRLLFERQDKAAVTPLHAMVRAQKTTQQGRVGAIWALQKLTEEEVWNIRNYPDEHAREQAFRMKQNQSNKVQQYLPPWGIHDRSKLVRFQTALALAEAEDPKLVANGVAYFAQEDGDDPWMRAAILSAGHGLEIPILRRLIAPLAIRETYGFRGSQDPVMVNAELVSTMVKAVVLQHQESKLRDLVHTIIQVEPLKLSDAPNKLIAIARGIKSAGQRFEQIVDPMYSAKLTDGWLKESRDTASDDDQPLERRLSAIEVISLFDTVEGTLSLSRRLLNTKEPQELQAGIIEALGSYREPAVADMLIEAWPKLTPALRDKATTILLSRTDRITKLLDAIESKKILPSQLSAATKATLGRQKTPALAERIAKLIGDGGSSNRKEVITKYEPVLSMTGDTTRGAKIYETLCMVCHRHLDRGNDVGPNLGTIKAWTAEQILTNVLDPNREVSPNFALYIVETNDGRTLSGLITSETAGNLTLKRADGGTDTVLRSEIKSLTSPGISLMPEGLEAAITPQQMADLITYLKQ
jgi:putative membrane-bound dehydrogenase-like protein